MATVRLNQSVSENPQYVAGGDFGAVIASTLTGVNHIAAVVDGDLTVRGTITGATTGNITGNVTGNVTGNLTGAATLTGLLTLKSYTMLTLPTATAVGQVIYVSDAVSGAVTGAMAFSNATGAAGWISTVSGVAVAAA